MESLTQSLQDMAMVDHTPRVAARHSRQPWAIRRNPFGILGGDLTFAFVATATELNPYLIVVTPAASDPCGDTPGRSGHAPCGSGAALAASSAMISASSSRWRATACGRGVEDLGAPRQGGRGSAMAGPWRRPPWPARARGRTWAPGDLVAVEGRVDDDRLLAVVTGSVPMRTAVLFGHEVLREVDGDVDGLIDRSSMT